jgi:hypothetical protein
MGNPGGNFPGDIGYGAGKIKITNNSTAVVIGVTVHEGEIITQTSKFVKLPYGSFNPPSVINPSRAAEVDVVGTGTTIDIKNNPLQRIQVELRTADDEDLVLVERIAKVDGQVVNIVIDNASLGGGGSYGRTGSKVTVKNETLLYPTTITSMYVFNMTYPNEMMLYPLNISSPTPHTQDLYVLDSLLLPIRDANRNHQYGVSLTVSGNGNSLTITKAFEPDSILYSKDPDNHLRTVTLTDDDLPDELRERFVPVTYIGLNPNPYKLTAYTKSDANEVNFEFNGSTSFNLNTPGLVVVSPAGATKTEPILWTLDPAAHSLVSFNSTSGHFTVTGIIPEGQRKVRLNAVIQEAAGTVANKIDFTGYVEIEVVYENIISSRPVTAITLVTGVEYKIVDNGYFDLRQLVQGFEPNPLAGGHNLNGRPITKDDIVWYIDGIENTTGYIYAPETPGTGSVMVRAVLPAVNSSGTQVNSTTVDAYTTLKLKRGMKIIITY